MFLWLPGHAWPSLKVTRSLGFGSNDERKRHSTVEFGAEWKDVCKDFPLKSPKGLYKKGVPSRGENNLGISE